MNVNFRKTPARDAITDFLYSSDFPVDIEQIISFLRARNLKTNKVTVYRIIDLLYKNRIIDRVELGEGKYRYEVKKGDHHHLMCQECGEIEDVSDNFIENFEKEIKDKKGFLVKSHSLEFFGLCKNCQR